MNNKIAYTKVPITIKNQISLLKDRKLNIDNESICEDILKMVSYYRLSAYSLFFEETDDTKKRTHIFYSDTTFDDIYELYTLDSKLRYSILKATTELEIYFKTKITYNLSIGTRNTFVLYDSNVISNYNKKDESNNKSNTYKYCELLNRIETLSEKSQEVFIKHYKEKYTKNTELPIWMATEIMTLGNISALYGMLKPEYVKSIRVELGVSHKDLISWLHTITYLRNLCAHNCRLFNRAISVSPRLRKLNKLDNSYFNESNSKYKHRIYQSTIMLDYILSYTNIYKSFIYNIFDCIDKIATSFPHARNPMGIFFDGQVKPLYSL